LRPFAHARRRSGRVPQRKRNAAPPKARVRVGQLRPARIAPAPAAQRDAPLRDPDTPARGRDAQAPVMVDPALVMAARAPVRATDVEVAVDDVSARVTRSRRRQLGEARRCTCVRLSSSPHRC
jgi:hypothetical protein